MATKSDLLLAKLEAINARTNLTVTDHLFLLFTAVTGQARGSLMDLWAIVRDMAALPLGTDMFQWVLDQTPPSFSGTPVITGTGEEGTMLTLTDEGGPTGAPTPTVAYEWFVDGVATGQTNDEYEVQASDVGLDIECRVTAVNITGSVTAASNAIEGVAA